MSIVGAELARINDELAFSDRELAQDVTTRRERVALSLGPADGDDGDYWRELAEWTDWTPWVTPPDERVDTTPDWRQT